MIAFEDREPQPLRYHRPPPRNTKSRSRSGKASLQRRYRVPWSALCVLIRDSLSA